MGWLGWTEEQTLQTTIPALELAIAGRSEMINAIFGGGSDKPSPTSKRHLTPELFDALFGGGAP